MVDSVDAIKSVCDEEYIATDTANGFTVGVKKASGTKCGRCWFYDDSVGNIDSEFGDICQRCDEAIKSWEKYRGKKFSLVTEEEVPAL